MNRQESRGSASDDQPDEGEGVPRLSWRLQADEQEGVAEMGKWGRTVSIREMTCLSYRLINEVWSQDSPLTLNPKRLHGPHEDVKGPGYKSWR